ncbi:hypothetical protein GTQ38_19285 [Flavobacteriaceae bacterium R33]|uniref:UbiA prenyltransferase family protein n=2 Tax=Poritiphilus flavus TaxID=2697053 RepID=A0A6L9EHN4_9FLAO|nr:hypothetical protein [Poritiphilus flavus]
MKILWRVLDFYLDASIHVALAVFCLIYCTAFFLQIRVDEHLALYVLTGTIASYNFIKYGVEAEKYILVANRYHKNIQFFSFIALGFAAYHAWFLNLKTWIGIGVLIVLTGLYALPLLPQGQKLRSLGLLKIILVALIWSGTTVFLPVLSIDHPIDWDTAVEGVQRFLLVLVLLVPFEVRDLKYDQPELRTLPQRLGLSGSRVFGIGVSVVFFFLTFLKDDLHALELIAKAFLFLILALMLVVTRRDQSRYFASLWVEAIPILWLGIIWLLWKFS